MTSETGKQKPAQKEVLKAMDTLRIGKYVSWLSQTDSTNAYAASMAKAGAQEGTVVVSHIQNAGYGRMNRQWVSPRGGLWFSIILRPGMAPKNASVITLMGACGVVRTLKSTLDMEAKIKWPNDVLISGKKVCGILTEMRTEGNNIEYIILGIGINVNFTTKEMPEDIREKTTTLSMELGEDMSIEELLKSLILDIDYLYDKLLSGDPEFIINMWKSTSDTLGRNVRINTLKENVDGIAVDVDGAGALIVETEEGEIKTILAGDCVYLTQDK
jgi:BirA family biotin operon repressor/biotin-[acetyl-CoA-carboxylase] ligase